MNLWYNIIMMRNKTSDKIIDFIKTKKQASAKQISDCFLLTPRAVFKQLKNLYEKKIIDKIGKPPRVYYFIKEKSKNVEQFLGETALLPKKVKQTTEDNYYCITPYGEVKEGLDGFIYWCQKNKFNIFKTAKEYVKTLSKYNHFKKAGLINGLSKIKNTFNKVYLDYLYYIDFYSIERFGKTKLGQLLLYAKQSQDKKIIKELSTYIYPFIKKIIIKHNISAIGFIPPTVKREIQFIRELEKNLSINLPIVLIKKIQTPIIVPQKTLNKLADRIINAKTTIFVESNKYFNNVLLIDDAVGSGATLNETAKQIKDKKISRKIIGLSITGSFKGFDVISEI